MQFSSVRSILQNSQRDFFALRLREGAAVTPRAPEMEVEPFGLEVAEADGTLAAVGSTFSPENDAVYDGISRPGVRLVTFAPILKHERFPLPALLRLLLDIGRRGTSAPVEIEFAVNLTNAAGGRPEFGFLQLRPLALSREMAEISLEETDPSQLLCRSAAVLGHGRIEDVRDLLVVDFHRFDRMRSAEVAQELGRFNAQLVASRRPYLLFGVGRWGSADPYLGIPVTWDQIAGARVIVEAGFRDFQVAPSQGTHFFQNLTSSNVGYFTVNPGEDASFVDWDWLAAQPATDEVGCVRLLRFPRPVVVTMDGRRNAGWILKPDSTA